MLGKLTLFTTAFLILSIAFASDSGDTGPGTRPLSQKAQQQIKALDTRSIKIRSDILHHVLKNQNGETLGEIEEVVADSSGKLQYVVVDTSEIPTAGDELKIVPWQALKASAKGYLLLNMSRAKFAAAPGFDHRQWGELPSAEQRARVYEYFDVSYQAPPQNFRELDRDEDGLVSEAEARNNYNLESRFNKLDTNNDGQLTRSEFSAFETSEHVGPQAPD